MESCPSYKVNIKRRRCYIPGAMFGPFSFINIYSSGNKEVVDADQNGLKNMVEIAVTLQILQLIHKEGASTSKNKISIAVLSPYPAQVLCLQQKVAIHYQNSNLLEVKVGFLHEYDHQDAVEDVVIISTVGDACNEDELQRSTPLLNPNEYLKSESRSQCVWILGDERVVQQRGGSYWEPLIRDAKARQCFFQADEHKDLAKVILQVKKDLHQLDELLIGETSLF